MALSQDLISQFVKSTKPTQKKETNKTVQGTTVEFNGKTYVRLDGSELLTPVNTTVKTESGERVNVTIENHKATITGNISSPAASNKDVEKAASQISEFDYIMAYSVTTENLEAMNATIETLKATTAKYEEMFAVTAEIETLQAKIANLDKVSAKDVEAINAEFESIQAMFGDFTNITVEDLEAMNASVGELTAYTADFTYVSADRFTAAQAEIDKLDAEKANIKDLNAKYANIDFANIQAAAIEKLFSDSGIIENLVMKDGHVTGRLVGVTIIGDIIEAGTLKADKLVVLGDDGLFYKLNVSAESVAAEQTNYNSLSGSIITAKSITAEKIKVTDLVAFGATIGGFHITDDAIYSGVKESALNTTRGIYMDKTGQFAVGDTNNFFRYFYDEATDTYKLEISASVIKMGGTNKTVEQELQEIRDEVTTNLRIESSRGTVFKNDSVSTVLSAVIYRGSQRITNITDLRSAMGSGAYLQWKWQRLNDDTFGVILATDERIGNDGFTFTLSPDDVDTKVTFMCELIA